MLKNYQPLSTDKVIEAKLQEYITKIEARSIDVYKQAEGITTDSVSIAGQEIKADDK